ncbi:DUF2344 domain-containing protein, partial [bacterium]|nr:DUF2344 domain-containing protein [bacterium]
RRADSIARKHHAKINVSISPFIPKPHTPFAWEAQDPPDEIRRKLRLIRDNLPNRHIKISSRNPNLARIEVALSRGNREIADVIEGIWRKTGGFDAWRESFDARVWEDAFTDAGLDLAALASAIDPDSPVPWDIVNKGIPKRYLLAERARAYRNQFSTSCYERGNCEKCGICDFEIGSPKHRAPDPRGEPNLAYGRRTRKNRSTVAVLSNNLRIRYSKTGNVRWLGHLDTTRAIGRAFRRSGVKIAYSEGHHQHQKIAFGPPLPTGFESRAEYMDVEFLRSATRSDIAGLSGKLPKGFQIIDAQPVFKKSTSLFDVIDVALFRVIIPKSLAPDLPARFEELLSMPEIPFERRKKTIDLKKYHRKHHFALSEGQFELSLLLQCNPNGSGRPNEYLVAAGLSVEDALRLRYVREELLIERNGALFNPFGRKWGTWEEEISHE